MGLLLKAANLLHSLHDFRQRTTVLTWNAESNEHPIAVNEAMGFRRWDRWATWQLRV